MIQTPCEEIFGHPKGLFSRCFGVGIPTHKVFGRPGYNRMCVCVGVAHAVHNSRMLAENEVGYVWPAYRGASPESPNVQVLDFVDGTGVANGDINF